MAQPSLGSRKHKDRTIQTVSGRAYTLQHPRRLDEYELITGNLTRTPALYFQKAILPEVLSAQGR
jgi:hypothetical protein